MAKTGGGAGRGRGGDGSPSSAVMRRAGRAAGRSPSQLEKLSITTLLASRGLATALQAQYRGVRGGGVRRSELVNRIRNLNTELRRRGISNPMGAVNKRWPDWNPGSRRVTFG